MKNLIYTFKPLLEGMRYCQLILLFAIYFTYAVKGQTNITNGLIGYYNFNYNGNDESGFENHALINGWEYVENRFGHNCGAIRLDGDGQYVEFPKLVSLDTPEWSYSIWFKLDQLPSTKDDAFLLSYKDIEYGDDVHLYVDNDDYIKIWDAESTWKTSSGMQVIQDEWYHAVITYDNNDSVRMYVNGELKRTKKMNFTSTGEAVMVSSNYAKNSVKGRIWGAIDEVRFYNRVINEQEVLAIYGYIDSGVVCNTSEISIPNVFTPNDDGIKDRFQIIGNGITSAHIKIYNRWGTIVYESNQINEGWDGKTKTGEKVPEGTYYYIIETKNSNNVSKTHKGHISLIR